ncbi:restriction endonuclease [Cotonvirus japonicus]|uniref:Restriction endonuclease n=1 Tax=Cotonvirus japonicus TaxID=2811091 RepID=A0ABM7NTH2_9VIRU|nr:restriction endonuclease [Cotonvirus japonicus]BCS83464.1 restriction endonuclease [Cotonvirus japonicus]
MNTNNNDLLCKDFACMICHERSFASSPYSKYWSIINKHKPRDISKTSINAYYLHCDKCNHDVACVLRNVTTDNWCGICNSTMLCSNNNCRTCFYKSFASDLRSKFWSKDNVTEPRLTHKFLTKYVIFDCSKCKTQCNFRLACLSSNPDHKILCSNCITNNKQVQTRVLSKETTEKQSHEQRLKSLTVNTISINKHQNTMPSISKNFANQILKDLDHIILLVNNKDPKELLKYLNSNK